MLRLEAGFRKNFLATEPTGDEYTLYFSPGNFAGVKPSIFSDEDYLPPRPQPHNYMQEIYHRLEENRERLLRRHRHPRDLLRGRQV